MICYKTKELNQDILKQDQRKYEVKYLEIFLAKVLKFFSTIKSNHYH